VIYSVTSFICVTDFYYLFSNNIRKQMIKICYKNK